MMSREKTSVAELVQAFKTWVPTEEDRSNFDNEIGLYDPETLSLVKLRRNGGIDLFAGTNEGIRIDPNQHRINLLSEQIQARSEVFQLYAGDEITLEAVQKILLRSLGDLTLETKGTLRLKANHIILESATHVDVIE